MKFMIIQENGRHEKNRRYRECFCMQRSLISLGQECDVWGLGHENFEPEENGVQRLPPFNDYDVIINLENYDEQGWVPPLGRFRAIKFLWSIDAHVKGIQSYRSSFDAGGYDYILQATPEFVTTKRDIWFPNCYDHTLLFDNAEPKSYDIGFCGNINNRAQILDAVEANFGLKRDIFVIGDDMVKAINSYKIHLNANIGIDINYRNFETIGCKTCLFTTPNQHYGKLGFQDGVNCMIYSSFDELFQKIRYILNHETERVWMEEAGYELAKQHTYDARANLLLRIIHDTKFPFSGPLVTE